jgi:hypothetical protein
MQQWRIDYFICLILSLLFFVMQVVDVLNESQEGDFGRRNDLKKQGE